MIPLLTQIPATHLADWSKLEPWPPAALSGAVSLDMAQAWLERPQDSFLPGRVWLCATPRSFVVLAELQDVDIMTGGRKHNDPLWDLGDVFEVFFRSTEHPEYYEFHVAPNGVTLDLRYPKLYASRAAGVEQYMVERSLFDSLAIPQPERGRWRAALEIPVGPLYPTALLSRPSEWQFSFSRYDCGPNRPPACASTSPHRVADFHQGKDWRHFRAPPFTGGR